MSEHMKTIINIMYNNWTGDAKLTKEEVAAYVTKKALTPEEYKNITNEDYVAPES